jgi:hypothetical protein
MSELILADELTLLDDCDCTGESCGCETGCC